MNPRALGMAWLAAAAWVPVVAGTVETWSLSTDTEFLEGTFEGTALDAQGRVRLALNLDHLWGPEEGIVWDLEPAGRDAAYVGLSSPGRVLRVQAGRDAEVWYEAGDDSLVAALVPDPEGGVYFGLSPSGRILRARGPGEVEALGESDARFIWAMTVTDDGSLWIGTGLPGRVLRRVQSEWVVVFETADDPVRCLAPLAGGGVLAGTGGRGRVIRIDALGRAFVVFDTQEAEIVALETAPDGAFYALAAQGAKQVGRPGPAAPVAGATESVRVTATAPGEDSPGEEEAFPPEAPARPQAPQSFSIAPGAALYRVSPAGDSRCLWQSVRDVPFDLLREDDGSLLVATGDAGRIFRIDERGRASVILAAASEQASALARTPAGRILIGTTTDARVESIGPRTRPFGTYLGPPVDAGTVADWGRLTWTSETLGGSELQVFARVGNTAEPDATWSDWEPVRDRRGAVSGAALPSTRWSQIRLDLRPSAAGESPLVDRLELFYVPRNRTPAISELTVEDPGAVWTLNVSAGPRQRSPLVADDPIARRIADELQGHGLARSIRRSYELGARTLSWKAADPDGDRLEFRLELRREDSTVWIPLALRLEDEFFAWDSRGVPDGLYRVRLTADDSRDNPAGDQLADQQVSRAFRIDNTRPAVGKPQIRRSDDRYRVEFVASDLGGSVAAVEIAVDSGEWQPLDPLDGIADSPEERYEAYVGTTPREPDATPTLRVRVTDSSGNLAGDAWALSEP